MKDTPATCKKKRPVNLDLTTLAFPPMAIASILHRVSGVVLFLLLPLMLYWLNMSLRDVGSFTDLQLLFANPYYKLILWGYLVAAWYHLIAGIRHMIMDFGIGDSLRGGRFGALFIMALGALGAIGLGIWIW